ncbi:MAG: type II toxin-antitoxin system HicA family toxin [bacterium]
MADLPAITGNELLKLLSKDGWKVSREATHGRTLTKEFPDRTRVTFIPETNESLPKGTLSAILGTKQTAIGRKGLF